MTCALRARREYLSFVTLALAVLLSSAAAPEVPAGNRYGVIAGGRGMAPEIVGILKDLDAGWVRLNNHMDGQNPDYAPYFDAGLNLVLTFDNHDPDNADTAYGTPRAWPNAGFPFRSKEAYQKRIRDVLAPLRPYLRKGRQIFVQCENEVGDATMNPKARYWRGTAGQYLRQLDAFYEAVRAISPDIPVVLTSFPSEGLQRAVAGSGPKARYAADRMTDLLQKGKYDAADLHFYGCVEDIAAEAEWVESRLPAGKFWISTENGGPDYRCRATPLHPDDDPAQFERAQAEQVPARLRACADHGALSASGSRSST